MLPNPDLKPAYDKVVWVYVYRDFSRKGQDHAAERTSTRFGVTSWPQLFLADPHTLEILAHTGREVDSFLAAVERTRVEATRSTAPIDAMREAEARADELEKKGTVKLARAGIDDSDIVVRTLALGILASKDPKAVAARATELLAVPNDPFRYEVCAVLAKTSTPEAKRALAALVSEPKDSLNPNVLRIRAVQALAACGDAESVDAIAPHARTGAYFNGLTGIAVDALAAIAERDRSARAAVREALKASYPAPPDPSDERAHRACVALAKRVHAALKEKRGFPNPYDAEARARLMAD